MELNKKKNIALLYRHRLFILWLCLTAGLTDFLRSCDSWCLQARRILRGWPMKHKKRNGFGFLVL